ncbi:MAG: ribosomal RNA small subunit methyltransferase A [Candidatus Dormibacteraeota bacterium]|nr:ribosomal RNA small subunit methyltransferase A [Candidatus Dormibacteraeota bacterium]
MPREALDLTRPTTVRAVARRAGIHPSKRLGQHFLIDRDVLEAIVAALHASNADSVLEVGCGIGTLTGELAAVAGRVVAVDVDSRCVVATRITQRQRANVEVLEQDAVRIVPEHLGLRGRWLAAGNLPYHLTGPILSHLYELLAPPAAGVFLVQREVAARLSASGSEWSLATVALRTIADCERLLDVPPSAFEPAPAVHSSVIRLTPSRQMDETDRGAVIRLARPVFQQRRKTIRHGVAGALGGDAAAARAVLEAAAIDDRRRPGTLDLDEWRRLALAVSRVRQRPG